MKKKMPKTTKMMRASKVPGHLNPADALTKFIEKEPTARIRHMMYLMGHHQDALALWEQQAGKEKAKP